MPKSYSDKERNQIIKKLKDEAAICMIQYGVRKTTVDELVKRVNIPKGTFYLFYTSKELLFFDVINDLHKSVETKLQEEMALLGGDINCDNLTELILGLYKTVDENNLLKIMTNGDLEIIMRKLPEEIVQEHFAHDDNNVEKLLSFFLIGKNHNLEHFSGAFRAVFLTMLHKREIGNEIYDDALKIMIRGIVMQLFEEDSND